MKKYIQRLDKFFVTFLLLVLCLYLLSSCQSTDKKESYIDAAIESAQFDYNSSTNKTKVTWSAKITNNTIYNIDSFSVTFELYHNSAIVDTQTYNYERRVTHGEYYTDRYTFSVDGKIDSIEYVSWTANYDTFWNTYKIWMIVMIALASVVSIIYIILMAINDFDLYNVGDLISDYWWILFALLVPIAVTVWGLVSSHWVPVLIVLGGIIAFIIVALLAHLVQYIIENLI